MLNTKNMVNRMLGKRRIIRRQDDIENSGNMQDWEIAKIRADDAVRRLRTSGLWDKKSVDDTEHFLKDNYERLRQQQIYNINDYRK